MKVGMQCQLPSQTQHSGEVKCVLATLHCITLQQQLYSSTQQGAVRFGRDGIGLEWKLKPL